MPCSSTISVPRNEKRVLHREHFNCTDLADHAEEPWLVCSLRFENGTANIGFLTEDASELSEVTEGDSVDEAPSWVPGTSRVIYQSAGLARSSEGFPMGTGPFAVMSLDLDSGDLEVLLQDDRYDFLTAVKPRRAISCSFADPMSVPPTLRPSHGR